MNILGVKCDNLTRNSALEQAMWQLDNSKKANLYFLNADCFYKTQKDSNYRSIVNSADLVLPDGIGLRIVARLFGEKIKENCNGTDFSPLLMKKAAEVGYKIFFLVSKEGIAEKAAENVRKQIPGVRIVGSSSGYFSDSAKVINIINDSGADILFVAMGAPLQEKWIAMHRGELKPRLCLGVGALFDYLSDSIPRAPLFMRKMHFEWLWRIFIEPRRMFKRYIIDGAKLFWILLKCRNRR